MKQPKKTIPSTKEKKGLPEGVIGEIKYKIMRKDIEGKTNEEIIKMVAKEFGPALNQVFLQCLLALVKWAVTFLWRLDQKPLPLLF